MKKLMKWLMVGFIPLFSLITTSCGSDEDEPNLNSSAYSIFNTQKFSKEWMVSEIKCNGRSEYKISYDANNRPEIIITQFKEIRYEYDGNTCALTLKRYDDFYEYDFKGYFEGNKLTKAEWDEYTITNVIYEGGRLVKGSNGYILKWDSQGNITNYSDGGDFSYSNLQNNANVDFNMVLVFTMCDCWCDDGSEYFTLFGWTGARATNLINARVYSYIDKYGPPIVERYEFTYELDEKGRPVEIEEIRDGKLKNVYHITYLAD